MFINTKKYNLNNSCVINCILNTFSKWFKDKKEGSYLTRNKILEIIDKKELIDNEETPLSINDIIPFFNKYEFGLKVFNKLNKVIYSIKPGKNGLQDKKPTLYILIDNEHCYLMDDNIKELSHLDNLDEETKPSPFYYINEEIKEIEFLMINSLDDIMKNVNKCNEAKEYKLIFVLKNDNLNEILYNLLEHN
jgi:hypothetical protein